MEAKSKNTPTWKLIHIKLSQIKCWDQNPRQSTKEQARRIVESYNDFGQFAAFVVGPYDPKKMVDLYDGHQRYNAWGEAFGKSLVVMALQSNRPLTKRERRKYVITTHAGATGSWDFDAFAMGDWNIKEMKFDGFDSQLLKGWQSDASALKAMLASDEEEPVNAEVDVDRAAELLKKWKVKRGDMFAIGEHRLLCGDSTCKEDVERVMGGEKNIFVFTDAPYGVEIVSTDKAQASTESDRTYGFIGAGGMVPVNAYAPIVGDDTTDTAEKFYNLCTELGYQDFVLWGGNYFTAFLPPKSCWIIWDKREEMPSNNFADCEMAWTSFDSPARIYRHTWNGLVRKGNRKDEGEKRMHPTQKPVGMSQQVIADFSNEDQIIYDGFLGSGTTLVACENLHRQCRAIKISPAYCSVILERMSTAFPELEINKIK